MRPFLVPLFLVLAAATVFADSADLSVRVSARTPDHPGIKGYLELTVHNAGPDTARNVAVLVRFNGQPLPPQPFAFLRCDGERCSIGDVAAGRDASLNVQVQLPDTEGTVTWSVTATSDTPDPNPQDNSATAAVELSAAPWIFVAVGPPDWIDPRMPFTAPLVVWTDNFTDAHDVVATVDLPDGVGVKSLPSDCTSSGSRVTCSFGDIPRNALQRRINLELIAPPRTGGETLTFTATVAAREKNFRDSTFVKRVTLSRSFVVTTTADDGSGSLRAAIDAANASCLTADDRCAIIFNIDEPSARPWKTIRVASPLPVLRVPALHVDGATQAAFSGVANPDGPSIEITGGAFDGDGLVLGSGSCTVTLANLAINGFRRFGILTDQPTLCSFGPAIRGNFIGTDPTGSAAVPNGRGIATNGRQYLTIESNTISGNVRSGIFAFGGDLRIIANRIGVAAHADTPLPNVASGVYISPEAGGSTLIDGNVVAFNGEMGLAIDRAASFTGGLRNLIWKNGGLAIDLGLDGFSPPNVPTIASAVFDPATGETTIRGTAAPTHGQFITTELFASDAPGPGGVGDAQRWLDSDPRETFEHKVKGDLRGQWISAATTTLNYSLSDFEPPRKTTEMSVAVQVR